MDGYWTGYADWTFTMTEITDEPVEAPAGLQTEQFIVKADGFSGCVANVGFLGSDVYVQGIFPDMPEAWVKGTINGDKAVFKNGQFLGADFENIRVQYLISATAESTYVEDPEWGDYTETFYYLSDEDITFDYDAATKTFTGTNLFVVNAGRQVVSYADIYENCVIEPFVEVAATPMAPSGAHSTRKATTATPWASAGASSSSISIVMTRTAIISCPTSSPTSSGYASMVRRCPWYSTPTTT